MHKLRKYQLDVVKWTDTVQHPAFFIEMRLGKNLITIRSIKRYRDSDSVLIVTSYSAFDGWQEEIYREFGQYATELTGNRSERQRLLNVETDFHWYIINWEGWRVIPEISVINWDCVVADESKRIANVRSKVSKYFVNNFRHAKHRFILTGTPDHHKNLDYYQQLKFLNPNILEKFRTYWDFLNYAFRQYGFERIMKPKQKFYLQQQLAKHAYFLKRKDVNEGRIKSYEKLVVEFPPKIRKQYDTVEGEYVLEGKDTSKTLYAINAHSWMMRMCGGFIQDEFVFHEKFKCLHDLLHGELSDEPVVIVCRFIQEIEYLSNFYESSEKIYGKIQKTERRKIIRNFNQKKFLRLFVQPQVVKHGLDLSTASTLIFYSQPNGKETRQQVEDRIITMSNDDIVLILDILVKDTVDYDERISQIEEFGRQEMFRRAIKRQQKLAA